uniref:Uncharacterized protein n=1 Tax=Caenorhabditis japonica TaxID=281687 RepID=A0A8R1DQY1_CAEJA
MIHEKKISRHNNNIDDEKCFKELEKNSTLPSNAEEAANGKIVKWANAIRNTVSDVISQCAPDIDLTQMSDVGFYESILSIASLNYLLTTEKCRNVKNWFDAHLIAIDQEISMIYSVPFERSYCGWQFGYTGKVFFRQIISSSCGMSFIEINHCCAEQMTCFMERVDQKECDQRFGECHENVISKMTSWKTTCEVYAKNVIKLFPILHKAVNKQIVFSTKIDVFNGDFKQALTSSETSNFEVAKLRVYKLSYFSHIDPEIRDVFNTEVIKHGWSKRIVVDSCGLMVEECLRYDKKEACLRRFVTCLNDVHNKTKKFDEVVKKLDKIVTNYLLDRSTTKQTEKMIDEKINEHFWKSFFMDLFEFFIYWCFTKCCFPALKLVAVFKKYLCCCNSPQTPPTSSGNDPSSSSLIQENSSENHCDRVEGEVEMRELPNSS